ncbi:MAG: PAS domain-containing protein, partial [Calditrichota bacterium]
MLPIKRYLTVTLAIVAIAAGTSLLLGNLGNANSRKMQLEQARVEALAKSWESRLDQTRSTFRDLIVRYGLLTVLDHPEEWSSDRVEAKFTSIESTWGKEAGIPKSLLIIRSDGTYHTLRGDTLRLSEGLKALAQAERPDVALLPRTGTHSELLILSFEPTPAQVGHRPGRLVALVDPAGFIAGTRQAPGKWVLLSGPGEPLIVAQGAEPSIPINNATWPLLLSEGTGFVPLAGGTTLCFSKIQIPGMKPLLLVQPYRPASATMKILAVLFIAAGMIALLLRRKSGSTTVDPIKITLPPPAAPGEDTAGFRQVFHALDDPVCVVDHRGIVTRANNKAHQWFQFHKGAPRGELVLWRDNGECRLQDLLKLAVENPDAAGGPFSMVMEGQEVVGSVQATPLGLDKKKDHSVLVHFRLYPVSLNRADGDNKSTQTNGPDPNCPYPVLAVSPDGLVVGFNDAAKKTCPRLDESPLVSDILPEFGENNLSDLLNAADGHSFESLFGRKPHEFKVVRRDGN